MYTKEEMIKDLEFNIEFFTELANDIEGTPYFDGEAAKTCRERTVEPLKRVLEYIKGVDNDVPTPD